MAEFVLARLAEDEAVARETPGVRAWECDPHPARPVIAQVVSSDGALASEVLTSDAQHIARWDPARVLADIEAKRRIVEIHHPHDHGGEHGEAVFCNECQWDHGDDEPRIDNQPVEGFGTHPCQTLLALALPDAGHPDFKDEWLV